MLFTIAVVLVFCVDVTVVSVDVAVDVAGPAEPRPFKGQLQNTRKSKPNAQNKRADQIRAEQNRTRQSRAKGRVGQPERCMSGQGRAG